MTRRCMVSNKGTLKGNNVSHSNRKVKRKFKANVRWKRFWVPTENKFVRMRVSSYGMRRIDKLGIDTVLIEMRAAGEKV